MFFSCDQNIIREDGQFKDKKKHKEKLEYFIEQINLFRAICEDANKEGQRVISQLIPVEFLLFMLNSKKLYIQEKRIFVELLQELYINHYALAVAQDSLMPEILLWRKAGAEKSLDTLFQEEKNKLFTHNLEDSISPFSFDESETPLNHNVLSFSLRHRGGD